MPFGYEETLSQKRGRAGTKGAAARWGGLKIVNQADAADIYFYDEISPYGITAKGFVEELTKITTSTVNLHINSPGGDVFDGVTIYNALKNHSSEVSVYVDGLAASAASFIAMAGDRRVIAANAMMMVHPGQGVCFGPAEEMAKMANLLDKIDDDLASIYSENASGTTAEWHSMMQDETWFNAKESVDFGLMHEIDSPSNVDNKFDLSIFNYRGRGEAPTPVRPDALRSNQQPTSQPDFGALQASLASAFGKTKLDNKSLAEALRKGLGNNA